MQEGNNKISSSIITHRCMQWVYWTHLHLLLTSILYVHISSGWGKRCVNSCRMQFQLNGPTPTFLEQISPVRWELSVQKRHVRAGVKRVSSWQKRFISTVNDVCSWHCLSWNVSFLLTSQSAHLKNLHIESRFEMVKTCFNAVSKHKSHATSPLLEWQHSSFEFAVHCRHLSLTSKDETKVHKLSFYFLVFVSRCIKQ